MYFRSAQYGIFCVNLYSRNKPLAPCALKCNKEPDFRLLVTLIAHGAGGLLQLDLGEG